MKREAQDSQRTSITLSHPANNHRLRTGQAEQLLIPSRIETCNHFYAGYAFRTRQSCGIRRNCAGFIQHHNARGKMGSEA